MNCFERQAERELSKYMDDMERRHDQEKTWLNERQYQKLETMLQSMSAPEALRRFAEMQKREVEQLVTYGPFCIHFLQGRFFFA